MSPRRGSRVLLLSALLVAVGLVSTLADAAAPALSIANLPIVDTSTVERMRHPNASSHSTGLSSAAYITETVASQLAADLLLSSVDYRTNLPIITK